MKINSLINQLEQRLKTMRLYSNEDEDSRPEFEVKRYADHLKRDDNCLGYSPIIGKKSYHASDMCLLGPGAQKELGVEWNLPLPQDYLAFCSKFDDYLFAGGAFFVLETAAEVKESVLDARNAVDFDPSSKHRLFNFSHVKGMPGYFAFRWSKDYRKMDVVFAWDYGDVCVPDLLGEPGDRFSSDPDFTSWLARMIETESTPLFPGGQWPMADGGWYEDDYPYFKRLT